MKRAERASAESGDRKHHRSGQLAPGRRCSSGLLRSGLGGATGAALLAGVAAAEWLKWKQPE